MGTSQHRTVRETAHLLSGPLKWYGPFGERNLLSLPGNEPLFPNLSTSSLVTIPIELSQLSFHFRTKQNLNTQYDNLCLLHTWKGDFETGFPGR
jgi:hypothetical protein